MVYSAMYMPYLPVGGWGPGFPASQSVLNPMTNDPRMEAETLKNAGNEFRKRRMYPQALASYQAAIQTDPQYADAYYNMAMVFKLTGDTPRAIQTLTSLLNVAPQDHDSRVLLGELYEKAGYTQEAKRRYMEVLQVRPDFDPARRNLNYLLYLDQKRFFPDTVGDLIKTRNIEAIHQARALLKTYFTEHHANPVLLKLSQELPIVFENTQSHGDSNNLAEYDAGMNAIRVRPKMLFSTPNVVGAYLVHELVHALDGNYETSIMEEQDGYRELAKFWTIYKGGESDPNLDRAIELYQKSPDSLDMEVRRVYSIQNAGMPEKSAGHGLPPDTVRGQAFEYYEKLLARKKLDEIKPGPEASAGSPWYSPPEKMTLRQKLGAIHHILWG